MRAIAVLQAALLCFVLACGSEQTGSTTEVGGGPDATASAEGTAREGTGADADGEGLEGARLASTQETDESRKAARSPGERPLPAFGGPTLDGSRLSISSLIGRRMLIFFFNPESDGAGEVADAVVDVARDQQSHNFRVVGVGIGSDRATLRTFAEAHGLDFPVIDDSSGQITSTLGLSSPMLILGADAEGYVGFFHPAFDTHAPDAEKAIASRLRESLRIAEAPHGGALVSHPKAPSFRTEDIDGEPFDFASLAGRPKIVMFFLHTCPHCHRALEFFEENLAKIPEAKRPVLGVISIQNRPSAVRIALGELGIDSVTPLVDPGSDITNLYGATTGVPDIALVDANDRIVYRMQGWRDDRDPALVRMYLSRIAGEPVPMLLSRNGYTGNDACAVCHEVEAATWQITPHARAYDTLVTHGQERDTECIACHVVGYDEPGGYTFETPAPYLEGVGCESCHGRGGPHLSPDFVSEKGYAAVCESCHDTKHSLGFEFATFLPGISHTAIAGLSDAERTQRFEQGLSHRELLPASADYVGSDACQSCHAAEFQTWADSPHAHSIASLEAAGKADQAACLQCHTTAFGRNGGFPKSGKVAAHADLARVGCESCHGPGGDHAGAEDRRIGTIVSLGDKCDSCVILQICGSCHDAANDADFEFSVQQHIDRQRHGTIEAGTGKPIGTSARRLGPVRDEARIAQALRWLERPATGTGSDDS